MPKYQQFLPEQDKTVSLWGNLIIRYFLRWRWLIQGKGGVGHAVGWGGMSLDRVEWIMAGGMGAFN